MTGTELTLDGVDLSDVLPEAFASSIVRGFLGAVRDVVDDVPGRPGAWAFDEEPGLRQIVVEVTLPADTPAGRRAAIGTLADWVDLETDATLIIGDELDRYWLVKLAGMSDPEETILTGVVELTFRASPYSFALELSTLADGSGDPETLDLADAIGEFFVIPDTVKAYPVLELTAVGAMPAGFALLVNGLELSFGTALADGDVVTISSLSFTVNLGVNQDLELAGIIPTDLAMADLDGDFPILAPGTNSIAVDGGASTVAITWRRRYR